MIGRGGYLLLFILVGCTSTLPRVPGTPPRVPLQNSLAIQDKPSVPLPVRLTSRGPVPEQEAPDQGPWLEPPPAVPASPVATLSLLPTNQLPLPQVRPSPLKSTPLSRSWAPVAEAKGPALLPTPSPVPTKTIEKKAETKLATVPAQPQASAAVTVPVTTTSAPLLSVAETEAADFQWQDVNALVGDAVTLHFDRTNWLYLDTPAQQKTVGFQSIVRDKAATTFLFKPTVPGNYVLEFQRQDLVNQSTDVRRVRLVVAKTGTRTSATGTTLAPQTSQTAPNDALEAARTLAASGKTAEAIQKLLQSYKADDLRTNLELARLLNQSGQSDEALTYLDKNLTLTGPDFQSTLELGTSLAASREPQKKLPAYAKLWLAGTLVPPEDLYLQVFEALRTQKLALLKDWSTRYSLWYTSPRSRDRYLFQMGQWLEEPGEFRDVRGAWKAYNEIVQSFPLSPLWKTAGERAAYINRHFLQVR